MATFQIGVEIELFFIALFIDGLVLLACCASRCYF